MSIMIFGAVMNKGTHWTAITFLQIFIATIVNDSLSRR